jgi:hypothetical protein
MAVRLRYSLCLVLSLTLIVPPVRAGDPAPLPQSSGSDTSRTAIQTTALTEAPASANTIVEGADCYEQKHCWVQVDYLLWWIKRAPLATPLVTTDPSQGVAKGSGGLANPTTQVVLGGGGINFPPFSGIRIGAGYALGNGFGIEAGGFLLEQRDHIMSVASDPGGAPFLLRPIVNTDANNLNAGIVVSLPLESALKLGAMAANPGAVQVNNPSQLWGADAVATANVIDLRNTRLTGLFGFRYLDLREATHISTEITDFAAGITFGGVRDAPGDGLLIIDDFQTRNHFYGAQMGLRGETRLGSLVLEVDARVSLGDTQQIIAIQGSTTHVAVAGGTQTLPGGWLALPSNSSTFRHDEFTAVPEVNLNFAYDLRSWLRLSVGYTFLFWGNVVRPGDQIVPEASAGAKTPPPFGQVPTFPGFGPGAAPVPPVPYHTTSFAAHGLNFGASIRF